MLEGLFTSAFLKVLDGKIKLENTSGPLNKFYTQENLDQIIAETGAKSGDVIFMIIGDKKIVNTSLSFLRSHIAKEKEFDR